MSLQLLYELSTELRIKEFRWTIDGQGYYAWTGDGNSTLGDYPPVALLWAIGGMVVAHITPAIRRALNADCQETGDSLTESAANAQALVHMRWLVDHPDWREHYYVAVDYDLMRDCSRYLLRVPPLPIEAYAIHRAEATELREPPVAPRRRLILRPRDG